MPRSIPQTSRPFTALILSRDLATARGGVASFVRSQIREFAGDASVSHLTIGRRSNESYIRAIPRIAGDIFSLRRLLESSAYDVVQINPSLNLRSLLRDYIFCRTAIRRSSGRLAVVFHGWDPALAGAIGRNTLLRRMFSRSFGRADLFVVLAPQFADQARAMGVAAGRIRVLTTMFDEETFHASRQFPDTKRKTILFMSRLVAEKGAADMIEAFARGKDSLWPDWRLIIAGDGPDRDKLSALARSVATDDSIALPGYLVGEDKLRLLSEASVFALPTRYNEGIPISLIEAMCAGCALLTSKAGGLGSILRDGENGVVLEDPDAESIYRGLERLTSDANFLSAAQQNCHRVAWDRFGSSRVFEQLRLWMQEDGETRRDRGDHAQHG